MGRPGGGKHRGEEPAEAAQEGSGAAATEERDRVQRRLLGMALGRGCAEGAGGGGAPLQGDRLECMPRGQGPSGSEFHHPVCCPGPQLRPVLRSASSSLSGAHGHPIPFQQPCLVPSLDAPAQVLPLPTYSLHSRHPSAPVTPLLKTPRGSQLPPEPRPHRRQGRFPERSPTSHPRLPAPIPRRHSAPSGPCR